VAVVELVRLERGGLAAVDPRLALRKQAQSVEPAVRIVVGERVEAPQRVDLLDAFAETQAAA
jgi:hypothetical protein